MGTSPARTRYRRSGAILLLLGLILGMVGVLAGTASAVDMTGKFQLDGDAFANTPPGATGDDWSTLFPGGNPGQSLGRVFVPDLEASDTSYYVGGSTKDDLPLSGWLWDTTSHAPDKNDITNAYAASYLVGTQTVVTFGADRFDVSGDAQMGFWFLQGNVTTSSVASGGGFEFSGDHQVGDVLVLVDFTNGGTSGTVSTYTWVGSGGNVPNDHTLNTLSTGGICDNSTSSTVCAIANTTDGVPSPWPYVDKDGNTSFQKNAFIEGAINLSALFPNANRCFSSFLAETRSSQEVGATLKDFALGGFHSCPQPTLATTSTPTGGNVVAGTAATDTLTVTGLAQNGFPSGTASFWLCGPATSSATVGCPEPSGTFISTATISGPSNGFVGTAQASVTGAATQNEGLYCWRASYAPDSDALYTTPTAHTNNDSECFTVVKPNVRILKTAVASPVTAGDQAQFDIAVHNDGPGVATTVTVSDNPLPSGIDWSDNSANCSVNGAAGTTQTLSCSWPTIAAGTTETVRISGTTDAADCGVLSNTATVAAVNEAANSAGDNTSTANLTVQCPNIRVLKTAGNGTINAGEVASFTIATHNDGPGTATAVTTTDTLPAGITWSESPDVAECSITSNVLSCNWGSVAAGTTKTVTVQGVTDAADCGTLNNEANVSATNEGTNRSDNSSRAQIVVNCGTINLRKTANPAGPVSAGTPIGFTIEVWNTGAGDVTSATVTDTLPTNPGTTWTVGGPDAGSCSVTAGVLSCDFGTIKSSDTTKTVTLSSPTTPATCGTVTNNARVTTGNDGSASSTATVTVLCPDVHVSKVGNGPIVAGDQATFTIGVGNAGPGTATAVTLNDTLPTGITWSESQDVAECNVTSGSSQSLSCTWPSVGPSTTKTVTITGTSSPGNCPSLSNPATVAAGNEPAADQSDNSATAVIGVNCADVHVSKVGSSSVTAGGKATFTLGVGNAGPTTATAVALTDHLPSGLTWAEDGDVAECSVSTGTSQTLSCTWSEVAVGTTRTVSVSGTTVAGNCPSISNTATVTARNETVANAGDNSATATIGVTCPTPPPPPPPGTPQIDLSVLKVDLKDPVTLGENIDYVMTVTNSGPDTATNVVATDPLPAGVTYVSSSASQGSCGVTGTTLTCSLGTMAKGASVTINLTVTPQAVGTYHNVVSVKGDQAETNTANNVDDEYTDVLAVEAVVVTPTTAPPTTTTTLAVLGVQLARTGSNAGLWLRLSGMFLIAGGLLLLGSDKRVWFAVHRR